MVLSTDSLKWSLSFTRAHADGDLFPRILEIDGLADMDSEVAAALAGSDLSRLNPGSCRRFIVPKDDVSYRQATQLDPQDSIILTGLVYQYGAQIEALRRPPSQIFSYRFSPTEQAGLYSSRSSWNDFWRAAATASLKSHSILYCDIADFYNQVSHHALENQLIAACLPNQAIKWIVSLLESTTSGVSRGVPVGPHAVHLLAELSLVPVDNSLVSAGIRFLRYADDIVVFCRSDREAKTSLATIAQTLDLQQRLQLQRHKTKFMSPHDFQNLCRQMIEDRPINSDEATLLALIKKYSGGSPYKVISYAQISPDDWASISKVAIARVIEEYIAAEPVDFIRLRWFYRRLAQIGHPGAIEASLDNIGRLGPCFANICFYLSSVQSISEKNWKRVGSRLLSILKSPEVRSNEYFRLLILSLFTRNSYVNHFTKLRAIFPQADASARREVILSARVNGGLDWIRELKDTYSAMDPWQQRAMICAMAGMPRDEKRFFIGRHQFSRPFDQLLAKWAKSI